MYDEFKTIDNLIAFHSTSESIMWLCDVTGVSVNDSCFDALLNWFDKNDPFYWGAVNMRETGGHFASSIADAYFFADSDNKARLIEAFRGLFIRFAKQSMTEEA